MIFFLNKTRVKPNAALIYSHRWVALQTKSGEKSGKIHQPSRNSEQKIIISQCPSQRAFQIPHQQCSLLICWH